MPLGLPLLICLYIFLALVVSLMSWLLFMHEPCMPSHSLPCPYMNHVNQILRCTCMALTCASVYPCHWLSQYLATCIRTPTGICPHHHWHPVAQGPPTPPTYHWLPILLQNGCFAYPLSCTSTITRIPILLTLFHAPACVCAQLFVPFFAFIFGPWRRRSHSHRPVPHHPHHPHH
eukprot:jgi/Mesvir1/3835/Mv19801-RA.1